MADHPPPTYVDTASALGGVVERVRRADRVVLDTEADSFHHYFEKVCLIQLSLAGDCYIVDPLADVDLSALLDTLARSDLVLHGADYDLLEELATERDQSIAEVVRTAVRAYVRRLGRR